MTAVNGQYTILKVMQALADNVGLNSPDVLFTSTERAWSEALTFANELGKELNRRFDWGAMSKTGTLTGTGADAALSLPSDFDRMHGGISVTYNGKPVRPLTRGEWGNLVMSEGSPRYYLLENRTVRFFPYLASADTATVRYISANWSAGGEELTADDNVIYFDEDLFLKGMIVRWRRQKGMDFADFEAEYEAALGQFANQSAAARF